MPEKGPKTPKKLTRREKTAFSQAQTKSSVQSVDHSRRDFLRLGLAGLVVAGGVGAAIYIAKSAQLNQQAESTPDLSQYTPEERSMLAEIYTKPSLPRLRSEIEALSPSVYKEFAKAHGLSSLKDVDDRSDLDGISIPVKAARFEFVTNDTPSGGGGSYFVRRDLVGLSSFKLDKPVPITIPIPHIQYTLNGKTTNLELNSAVKAGQTYYTGISPTIIADVPKASTIAREKLSYIKKFKDFYEVKEVFSHAFTMKMAEDMTTAFKAKGQRPTVTSTLGDTEMISTFITQLTNGEGKFKFMLDFGSFVLAVKAFADNPVMIQIITQAMGENPASLRLVKSILTSDLGTDVRTLVPNVIAWIQANDELEFPRGSFHGDYTHTP